MLSVSGRRFRRCLAVSVLAAAVAAIGLLSSASRSGATLGVLDQALTGNPDCSNFRTGVDAGAPPSERLDQEFVPSVSQLGSVELCLAVWSSKQVTLNIREGTADNPGTILATGTATITATGAQWVLVNLPAPLATTPGVKLVLEIPGSSSFSWRGTCGMAIAGCTSVDPDLYPAGESNWAWAVPDFAFRTYAGSLLGDVNGDGPTAINPADFQVKVDNPLLPLSLLGPTVFEGEEKDPDTGEVIKTRVESILLPTTGTVDGVEVAVVNEKDFENGELVESTLDYFAQHRNGDVYYFGERVDIYEGGKIVGHQGQWLAGEGKNEPGIAMPAHPTVGQEFNQENAPGIAEDQLTVLSLTERVTVPAGSYTECLKVADFNPLDKETEHKWFCPGVGMVHEEFTAGHLDLVSVEPVTPPTATPAPAIGPTAAPIQPTSAPAGVIAPATGDGTSNGSGVSVFTWGLAALGLLASAGGIAIAGGWYARKRWLKP